MAVNHIVYFKFSSTVKEEDVKKHMAMFKELADSVSGITAYSAGKAFKVSYEDTADYDSVHCVSFESKQALENYFFDERHNNFIEQNKHLWADVLVVNAEI